MKRSRTDVSRRSMLTKTAAAMAGAGAMFDGASAGQANQTSSSTSARTPNLSASGQTFRAYVRFGNGASVQELKLLPIGPRNVVVRTEAAQICYTTTAQALGTTPVAQAVVPAHGGVGIVIEVGSKVDRVQVGDRVIVAGQAQCGVCYNCLRARIIA
jgi:Alcohol dehydrogenase GroES-like domain